MPTLRIRELSAEDCIPIAQAFAAQGWDKPASQYQRYLSESQAGQRTILLGELDGEFAGYLTIVWAACYPAFQAAKIPEIVDFNVLKKFQRQGIGSALMDEAERRMAAVSPLAGIGVGLSADYGAAQSLYARRGYLPDGRGAFSGNLPLQIGEMVKVDHDLCLYFTKYVSKTG